MRLERKLSIYLLILVTLAVVGIQFIIFKNITAIINSDKKHALNGYSYVISKEKRISKNLYDRNLEPMKIHLDQEWKKFINLNYLIVMDAHGNIISYHDRNNNKIPPNIKSLAKKEFEKISRDPEKYQNSDINQFLDPTNNFLQQFVPILYDGDFVGILGIQEYYDKKNDIKDTLFRELILTTSIILAITLIFSIFLAQNIKKATLGLDPIEIGRFYKERQLIFDAISDEIITMDSNGNIGKMNKIAKKNLQKSDELVLKKLYDEIMETGTTFSNRECRLTSGIVFISSLKIQSDKENSNILFIIKSGEKIKKFAEEITGVTQIINSMRANVHEFKNKIHVISGLLRLEEYEAAKNYVSDIRTELDNENKEVEGISDPIIKALLLTKINLAKEKKIKLSVEEGSNLMKSHKNISSDDLIIIIGNLIENAVESFESSVSPKKYINVYLLEDSDKIFIQVTDNGTPIKNKENIFKIGISSKGDGRGSGLALIKNLVSLYNGTIDINEEKDFKTFSIELMKEEF